MMDNPLLEKILAQGFPTTRHEQWKYTSVNAIAARPFVLASRHSSQKENLIKNHLSDNSLIFINGYHTASSFSPEDAAKISISPLSKNSPESLPADIFDNLNRYFFQEGMVINITETLTHPLEIIYIALTENWVQPRNQIILHKACKATVVETFLSTASSITNAVTCFEVNAQATLSYMKIQQEHPKAFHIGRTHIVVQENGLAQTFTFSQGSLLARSDIEVHLSGNGAHTELYGLYHCKDRMHLDHHTTITHDALSTKSTELYHGILKDQSRAVFNGKILVKPHAAHTQAEQANHNLLLSSDAEIDTKPELEIYCDEVKCTHGATIGQLDESAIFYLRARGLEEAIAKKILIEAFSNKIISYISDDTLRKAIKEKYFTSPLIIPEYKEYL